MKWYEDLEKQIGTQVPPDLWLGFGKSSFGDQR